MNKRLVFFFVAMLLSAPGVYADSSTANRQTVLNDATDFMATLGRDPQDKKEIIQERRDIRREARLKSEERRKREATRKKMKAQEELIMRKIRANGT